METEATVAVLLGAGASVDADIPTSVGMTEAIIGRLQDPEHVRVLEFVRHTIAASLAQQQLGSGRGGAAVDVAVDVERLFASVELLIDRHSQAWSPFVATWHPGLESFAMRSTFSPFFARNSIASALERIASSGGTRRVAEEVAKFVGDSIQNARGGDVTSVLRGARGEMLRSLFDILSIDDPTKVAYLSPLVDLAGKQGALTIATLNYDRSIENAAEQAGVPYDTGIETWLTRGALEWPSSGLRLLKLHGSIDWVFERGQAHDELPLQHIRKVNQAAEKSRYDAPAVVFGEAGKLRSEGTYLELLLAWSTQLQEADSLVVVGYSFRDAHVNEVIARWFNSRSDRRVVVLDPGDLRSGGQDSFAMRMTYIDRQLPGKPTPDPPRVRHVAATTAAGLANAIQDALLRVGTTPP